MDIDKRIGRWRAWQAEDKARRWLADNVRYAQISGLSDNEILHALRTITSYHDPVSLLDVYCKVVERRPRGFQRATARVLARLATDYPGPGRDAVAVDRAIRRLLHRLPGPVGRPLAIVSLRSSRRDRCSAAWKFYRTYGLDDESRTVLEIAFATERHEEYFKLVAGDPALVLRLGAGAVIAVAPNRYWRSRVIQAVLLSGGTESESFRISHPGEWLWAVSRHQDQTFLPSVRLLLTENQTDVDLVNRVLLCLTALEDRAGIDEALQVAKRILDSPAPAPPD